MSYHRSKSIPKLPKNFPEIVDLLNQIGDIDGKPFYRKSNQTKFGNYIIFVTNSQIRLLNDSKTTSVDATFKVVPSKPNNFYQLFVICGKAFGHFHPLMYALMSSKNSALYSKIFQDIKQIAPNFEPDIFLCDFESGLINALRQNFKNSSIHGCWFHYTQAILRRIAGDGNKKLFMKSAKFRTISKRLFSLALLPPTKIASVFNKIKQESLELPFSEQIMDLFTYIESYWLNLIGCPTMSVYGNPSRTNNGQEALNSKLKIKIGVHQNFFVFLGRLKAFTTSMELDYERLKLNKQITRNKKRSTIMRSTEIKNANQLLENGDINENEFAEMVSNTVNSIVNIDLMLHDIEPSTDTCDPNNQLIVSIPRLLIDYPLQKHSGFKQQMIVSIPRLLIDAQNDICCPVFIQNFINLIQKNLKLKREALKILTRSTDTMNKSELWINDFVIF